MSIFNHEEEKEERSLVDAFANLFVMFLYPFIIMKGWDALAWHLNLPVFDYWQCFCIIHGFRYLFGSFFARSK